MLEFIYDQSCFSLFPTNQECGLKCCPYLKNSLSKHQTWDNYVTM